MSGTTVLTIDSLDAAARIFSRPAAWRGYFFVARGRRPLPAPARHNPVAARTGRLVARDADRGAVDLREIRAIGAGDSAAFRRLIDREAPRLLRFAQGMLGNAQEAEDVVQDTLIRLWEKAADWTPDARIGTWLHRVCYNRAIDVLRRRRNFVEDSALDLVADPAETAEAVLVGTETAHALAAAIETLPPRQRTAVLLFHVQELSQREAAAIMEISETAFESVLARARRQLRRLIGEDENG
jgi:RNA polymerase sigma-70 factor (ECF subfamily)